MSHNSASGSQPAPATSNTKWQESLEATCRERSFRPPTWQMFSDRRGGRTAWTCMVSVEGQDYQARNWYDGNHVGNAKEDAAEIALLRLGNNAPTSPGKSGGNGGFGAVGSR